MRKTRKVALGLLALSTPLLFASNAFAHSPSITATSVCTNGVAIINYTSTSWSPNQFEGENPSIDILVNNIPYDNGAYVFPGNAFSGSIAAPASTSATVTALAVDNWGDGAAGGQSASTTVSIPQDCVGPSASGRFTGGGLQVVAGGIRITRGLTIHCDLLLSNNLQVNWTSGNKFHMTEHLETIACTDDPAITQEPPRAPLDTLIGVGTGRYNGVDGYTIEFTLVDGGEPGGAVDQMRIRISNTADGTVVLDVPLQPLTRGNLQAHYDQPHDGNGI